MNDLNPLLSLIEKRKRGILAGIPSFCSANKIVIEAVLEQSFYSDKKVIIEATSNQVNQYGGYFHMNSFEFRDYVYAIANRIGYDASNIILGGDHLGPQPWQDLPESEAMANAKELVRQSVKAGFLKIHLDTSMRLGDDDPKLPLLDSKVAERGAILMKVAEEAWCELKQENPAAVHPVFVVGSEVPIPGGKKNDTGGIEITSPESFEHTLLAYLKQFEILGISDLWKYVIAIVVQPGVEFGEFEIVKYSRSAARRLCDKLNQYPDIVFEGHSTDYQSPEALKQMVEDGIAIIKVGPALTFALREALFALSFMERELICDDNIRANFIETLELAMMENPVNWNKYYCGTLREQYISRKYSYSDRCRYYLCDERVDTAVDKLIKNIDSVDLPMGMLKQYMPLQYSKVLDGKLAKRAYDLVKDSIAMIVADYNYATLRNYMVDGIDVGGRR